MAELKGTKTEKNLETAFAGESQARNKYTYYASQAKKEGYVQMMEPVVWGEYLYESFDHTGWALDGAKERAGRWIGSIQRDELTLQKIVEGRFATKYKAIEENEVLYEEYLCEDADILITAFGSVARIAKAAILSAREEGVKVGLFRPITLWPFPEKELNARAEGKKLVLDIEMNMGQMLEDVKIAVNGCTKVEFFGRAAGLYFTKDEILERILDIANASVERV
ncbi:hypothetical protein tpqmel_0083 [Candidatus Gastranaerophilus sp. (ex Termes propinquus)]|nr:hypothetical protein tpqmel_0083 [Candidatus Gastranaerophilus sp. (ex Termes propinquus)]